MSKKNYGPLHYQIREMQETENAQKKFYKKTNNFHFFKNINPQIIQKIQKILITRFPSNKFPFQSSKRYLEIINYLISPENKRAFSSFDEKILFLIMATDPYLHIYFYYLNINYSRKDDESTRNFKLDNLIAFIKNKIGIFDANFLIYEEAFFQHFLKIGSVISYINKDYSSAIIDLFKGITSFEMVSEEDHQNLNKKAMYYLAKCKNPKNLNTIWFNLINPNSELKINNRLHRIIFIILVIDPELNALKIYSEESNFNIIKKRMLETFGFYSKDFIEIEKLYQKRFHPNMKFDIWNL